MVTKRKAAARPKARRPVKKMGARKVSTTRKALAKPRKKKAAPRAPARRYAGVGDAAVTNATGRGWDEWLTLLDRAGARKMEHKDIARMLSRKFSVPHGWGQMLTVGYEQAGGLRKVNEQASGFAANACKTVRAAVDNLFQAWHDPDMRSRWLAEAPIEVKRSTRGKSMRIRWKAGESHVDVGFVAKGPGKSAVQLSHGKLKSAAEVLRQKAFWKDALSRLESLFEPVTDLK